MRISDPVLDVLSRAQIEGHAVRLTMQLDRKLYLDTNKVLEALGGKWNRKAKAHLFDDDPETRLEEALLTGQVEHAKDDFDFFATPPELAAHLAELADVKPGMTVLEPSAGHGALVDAVKARCPEARMVLCEISAANRRVLVDKGYHVAFEDFLQVDDWAVRDVLRSQVDHAKLRPDGGVIDVVVMNPPFNRRQDLVHVEHAMELLRPGGRLVAIMAAGLTFRQDRLTQRVREMIDSWGGRIAANPEASFAAVGTRVRTLEVVADKPR